MADPGQQLQKVLAFRRQLEDSRQVLYRIFADEKEFTAEVDRHLRAYAKGDLPKADAPREAVVLPLAAIESVKKAQAAEQRAESHQKHAEAQAARADRLANLGILYQTRGELDRAEEMLKKSLAIDEKLGR